MMYIVKIFSKYLFLVLFVLLCNYGATFADPYNLDLVETNCLAEDITTGPVGWLCSSKSGKSGEFVITFFGENKAGLEGTILSVESSGCNSFQLKGVELKFSELKIKDSKNFSALESVSEESQRLIDCTYIPPPSPPEDFYK